MKIRCFRTRLLLPALMDGARPPAHVGTCLACQAEATRYRALARRLKEIRHDVVTAPVGMAVAVAAALNGSMGEHSRSPGLGGAAAAAGAAIFVAWAVVMRKRARAA